MSQDPLINMDGDLVALGPLRRDLLHVYHRWINDFSALRTLGAVPPRPTTIEQETAWFDAQQESGSIGFTIYERATWTPIGNTALRAVDQRPSVAGPFASARTAIRWPNS